MQFHLLKGSRSMGLFLLKRLAEVLTGLENRMFLGRKANKCLATGRLA